MSERDGKKPDGNAQPAPAVRRPPPAAQTGPSPSNPPPSPTASGPRAGIEHQPPAAKPPRLHPGPVAKPAPKHPGFVTVTVDGKEFVAKPGENMVDAVKKVGSEIPYYCYHQRLSIAANCRMCLVEVFGTLFIFSLVGLVIGLVSDLIYMWIDPQIDFEAREV